MLTKILGHSPKTTIAGLLAAAASLWHDPSIRSAVQALLIAALGRLTQDSHGKPPSEAPG
jgi:hypothetical protein